MQEKLLQTRWRSNNGKIFQVVDVQDDTVWYVGDGRTYSCLIGAFKQRFKKVENYQYE
jgi:hypothetical protein